jgi:hypothetical protein
MPVGQSTETRQVDTVSKQMTLDVTMDDFAEQRVSLVRKLAARYSVDPSLVTLEVLPGSVQILMTIATTNGGNTTVNITTLEQAVAGVSDAVLAMAIGATMNTTVVVTSEPPVRGSIPITVPFSCPKGKWCTAGVVVDSRLARTTRSRTRTWPLLASCVRSTRSRCVRRRRRVGIASATPGFTMLLRLSMSMWSCMPPRRLTAGLGRSP